MMEEWDIGILEKPNVADFARHTLFSFNHYSKIPIFHFLFVSLCSL